MSESILLFRPQRGDTPNAIRERAAQPVGDGPLEEELTKIASDIDLTVGERVKHVGRGTLRLSVPPHRLANTISELGRIAVENHLGMLIDKQDFIALTGFEVKALNFSSYTLAVPGGCSELVEHWVRHVSRRIDAGGDDALIVHDPSDANGTTFVQARKQPGSAEWDVEVSSPTEREVSRITSEPRVVAAIEGWIRDRE